ncbi:unnamed protein product [Didymodactylos carnosus]|uniref:RING-type domain-containing protein n=1 Tax=Didymodactylos carnosus TaxID=1234261 RepID=A0A815LY71_9BILA|nr:unnamed protein product [Didymodactylos carnosus]CAF4299330.1 unnamed protein product [Didymodactylos carnosus]
MSQDDINKDVALCSICHHLLWKPVTCNICKNSFCYQCIHQRVNDEQTNSCPFGCEYEEQQCSSVILASLSKLQIECSYKSYGCSAIVSYDILEDHEQNCDYRQYQKQHYDVQQHLQECAEIVLKCQECSTLYQREDMKQQQHTKIQCLRQQMLSMQNIMEQTAKLQQATFSSILQKQQQQLNAIDENLKVQHNLSEQKLNFVVDKQQQLQTRGDNTDQKIDTIILKQQQQVKLLYDTIEQGLKTQQDSTEQKISTNSDKQQQQLHAIESKFDETISGGIQNLKEQMNGMRNYRILFLCLEKRM